MNVVDWTIKIGDVTFDCAEVYALHFDLGMNMMLEFKLTASSIVPPWATGTYPSKYHLQLSAALTLRKQGVHRLVDRICDFLLFITHGMLIDLFQRGRRRIYSMLVEAQERYVVNRLKAAYYSRESLVAMDTAMSKVVDGICLQGKCLFISEPQKQKCICRHMAMAMENLLDIAMTAPCESSRCIK